MRTIGLIDSSFTGQLSMGLGGENCDLGPFHIEWDRAPGSHDLTVFTDKHLREVLCHEGRAMALLVEPPSLSKSHYNVAFELADRFEVVMSPWRLFAFKRPNFLHYPLGGSWIAPHKWGLHNEDKTKPVSLILSEKTKAVGHRIRHEVEHRFGSKYAIDVWGRSVRPMESKTEALTPYCHSIVVESIACYGYFSEKLIDCLSTGTVPLYWGCPDIECFFPGISTWSSYYELEELLEEPPVVSDETRLDWLDRAQSFKCAEDNLFEMGAFDD